MNRDVSIFLDLARFLAAYLVFISHASSNAITGGLLWQIGGLGREAVDIFFVLSGFVIAHVTVTREQTARDFAVNRIARVASVALPALAATLVLDAIGIAANPAVYTEFCCAPGSAWWSYPRNLLFLGDIWSHHLSPGSNVPYWSLGFEAWYYLAFALFFFLPRFGWLASAIALLLAGPGIAILFPLWLLGVACHRWNAPANRAASLMAAGLAILLAVIVFNRRNGQIFDPFALSPARLIEYGHDYATALGFALFLAGLKAAPATLAGALRPLERPIRWLAGATFALYLFHMPLLRFIAAVLPFPHASWQMWATIHTCVPLATLALAEVTERRKAWWRVQVDRLIPGKA